MKVKIIIQYCKTRPRVVRDVALTSYVHAVSTAILLLCIVYCYMLFRFYFYCLKLDSVAFFIQLIATFALCDVR